MSIDVVYAALALLFVSWMMWHAWPFINIKFVPTAGVGKTLDGLLKIQPGTTKKIYVTGFDLHCLHAEHYDFWRNALGKWMNNGVEVTYFAHQLNDISEAKLAKMLRSGGWDGKKGKLTVRVINTEALEDEQWFERTKYEHYLLVDHPFQLWVEGFHAEGEPEATDCEYVRWPSLDSRTPVIEEILHSFQANSKIPGKGIGFVKYIIPAGELDGETGG